MGRFSSGAATAADTSKRGFEDDVEGSIDRQQLLHLRELEIESQLARNEDDALRDRANPQPWKNLLYHPSRALWRSSQLGRPPQYLVDVRDETLRRGGRTRRQLRRSFDRHVVAAHAELAECREATRANKLRDDRTRRRRGAGGAAEMAADPVCYGPEQTLACLHYRLLPNYAVVARVLSETDSLLIGPSPDGEEAFRPRRVIDVGVGAGAASAAALGVWGDVIEWVHGVDPSRSMRECAEVVLGAAVEDAAERKKERRRKKEAGGKGVDVEGLEYGDDGVIKARVTTSESLAGGGVAAATQKSGGGGGGFDLALCCYTASELPHTSSALSVAAILWEKLSDGGVLVFVEPGTPDGFNTVRAVRQMLLECCPPGTAEEAGHRRDGDDGTDECHVVAPCTHNGRCPMERYREIPITPSTGDISGGGDGAGGVYDSSWWDEAEEGGDVEFDEDEDMSWIDADFNPEEPPDWHEEAWPADEGHSSSQLSEALRDSGGDCFEGESRGDGAGRGNISEVTAFDGSFCSFVQFIHGGDQRSEKFSYVVLQKHKRGAAGASSEHVGDASTSAPFTEDVDQNTTDSLRDADLVDLLSRSVRAGGHADGKQLLQDAVELEDKFLDSDVDDLGLELVRRDKLGSWGRLIRAPIKRKGHVLIDFCSGRDLGRSDGRIMRHRVGRGKASKVAPGMYVAARKARWGGLWPDLSDRGTGGDVDDEYDDSDTSQK